MRAPGTLVGSGRNADVYLLGGGKRVLRRYRDGRDAERVGAEALLMTHVRSLGVPVPEVFDVSGPDIEMERADGPTMLDALGNRPWTLRAQAAELARLHGLVHRVPADGLPGDWLRQFPGTTRNPQADVLLHYDLHPQNVILTADGPVIIDWEGAARGPAVADIAMTWVIVGYSDVPGSGPKAAFIRSFQQTFTRSFVRAAGPLDEQWRARAVGHRLADPNLLPTEAARLRKLVPAG